MANFGLFKQNFYVIIFVIFISLFFNTKLYSENILNNANDKLLLDDIYILESSLEDGEYINVGKFRTGFKKYDMKHLPYEKKLQSRMYTFHTIFRLNENLKKENISIYTGPSDYPFNIYINGNLLFSRGRYKKSYTSMIYSSINLYLPKDILKYGQEYNELVVQAFPKHEKTPLSKIFISSSKKVSSWVFVRDLFNLHFIRGVMLIATFLFLYLLSLFISRKGKDLKYLYFALTCLFFVFGYVNISFSYDFSNEVLLEKISRIGFPLTTMFVSFFIMEFTGILNKKIWIKIVMIAPAIFSALVTLLQTSKRGLQGFFNITSNYFITPVLIFTIVILFISYIKYKNHSSLYILFGFFLVVITSIRDISYLSSSLLPYSWTVPYGYLGLVISIFFILSLEQSQMFTESISRTNELNIKNDSLKKLIKNGNYVSENLIESSKSLEESVSATISLVENYSESNKIIMDKVLHQFSDIEKIINQISHRIDISNSRIPQAILEQSAIVEEITSTIANMNSHTEDTMRSAVKSNEVAKNLSIIADESTKTIIRSKSSIDRISEYSNFINDVLNSIQDITGKTNLLSINASIEAANSGSVGKGFSIIAGEIRNLATLSKENLTSSFDKINEMTKVISKSTELSDDVSKNLFTIIEESKSSANMINNITELIIEQKDQSSAILKAVETLLKDTLTIKELSEDEKKENENINKTLFELKESFESISELLKGQKEKESDLYSSLNNIKTLMAGNLRNVDILRDKISI